MKTSDGIMPNVTSQSFLLSLKNKNNKKTAAGYPRQVKNRLEYHHQFVR
jgi:hypothetical protein